MIKPFSYNYYKHLKRPHVYLSYPNRNILCEIPVSGFKTDIMANSANKGSFKVYRYMDSVQISHYDDIKIGMYLYLDKLSWFVITDIARINEGSNEYLDIEYAQIERILGDTLLTSFGSLGVETDSQGGLDRYCLYNTIDRDHSIMHIVVQKNPAWSIGYIDPGISTEYRSFNEDSIASYDFLTKNVAETYECVFLFDPDTMEISAFKLDHLGKDTGITLSYRNFIKKIEQKSSDSNIKTVLNVTGGNDARTNTPLGIIDVNISGTNQIYDFTYYLDMMSSELRIKLSQYEAKCKENMASYQQKLSVLGTLYSDLNSLKNKAPDNVNSTDWTKFGLAQLQEKEQEYWQRMSLFVGKDDSYSLTQYKTYKPVHDAIEKELSRRNKQIKDKESEISSCQKQINSLVVRIDEFLGEKLFKELNLYIKEDTFTDDSFITTEIMTDSEILEMQKALLEHAKNELAKVCYPKFETTVDLINFTVDYDYKLFTDQLDMFNIIHIKYEENDVIVDARLLKIHINWDDPSDFKVTFSNRNSLDESFGLLEEVIKQTESNSSSLSYGTGAWGNAASASPEIRNYMNSVFDASLQMLQNSANQETRIDRTGILSRTWNPQSESYDPCQTWMVGNGIYMTTDGWDSVSLALGYVKLGNEHFYGLCAPSLVGQQILSSHMYISNESGSYTMGKDGLVAKNGPYVVKINPSTPTDIFSITIENKRLLYVDADSKKLKFEGDIESKSGHIANFTISENNLTSGGIGLCSLTTPGEIAMWAGNANKISAPFRVTNTGKVICSDIEVTGGNFKIGDTGKNTNTGFSVDENGTLKAKNAEISGIITAYEGFIGNFQISQDSLTLIKDRNMTIDFGSILISKDQIEFIDNDFYIDYEGLHFGLDNYHFLNDGRIYGSELNGNILLTGQGSSEGWSGYTLFEALDLLWKNRCTCSGSGGGSGSGSDDGCDNTGCSKESGSGEGLDVDNSSGDIIGNECSGGCDGGSSGGVVDEGCSSHSSGAEGPGCQ